MWAKDFRFSPHSSHFWTLLPIAKLAFSTLGLCQYTPSGVGTCPIIFVAIRFISAPLMPVISACGIRVVLVMSPPLSVVLNIKTPDASRMCQAAAISSPAVADAELRYADLLLAGANDTPSRLDLVAQGAQGTAVRLWVQLPRDLALGLASGCGRRTRGPSSGPWRPDQPWPLPPRSGGPEPCCSLAQRTRQLPSSSCQLAFISHAMATCMMPLGDQTHGPEAYSPECV